MPACYLSEKSYTKHKGDKALSVAEASQRASVCSAFAVSALSSLTEHNLCIAIGGGNSSLSGVMMTMMMSSSDALMENVPVMIIPYVMKIMSRLAASWNLSFGSFGS